MYLKNYKVCVYAITKNEEKFVKRWVDSMQEADKIIVLDTGSTDNTVNALRELGVEVYEKQFNPWRFDVARNEVLNLVPIEYDICVCTDLDEVFEKGWYDELLKVWDDSVTRVKYTYNWSFNEQQKPATTFLLNKIHKRDAYIWTHPVHEVLTPLIKEKEVINKNITLNHYPDYTKSRSNYLPLLELSVKEDPDDDRNMHYLGREYMYYQKYDLAIKTLQKHLSLEKATWKDERCASMRFIARCYTAQNDLEKAKEYYEMAINEAPYLREPYIELAYQYYEREDYLQSYDLLKKALEIKEKSESYINEEFAWNSFVYDLMGIVCFNLKYYNDAYYYTKEALSLEPDNLRLQINLGEIEKFVK